MCYCIEHWLAACVQPSYSLLNEQLGSALLGAQWIGS